MTLDKKTLILEGVSWHCGMYFAVQANQRFNDLYTKKHLTCLDNVRLKLDNPTNYARREEEVYNRYMMMRVHQYDKKQFNNGEKFP